ncbi:MAG: DNA alkylation repair protein [Planctomycetota bacterium]|nr:DNA alkylation repair protein [Planctomycetota bacterium]
MQKAQALKQLKTMGTAQNRKVYGRHGATGEIFGVSYANLYQLQKQIGTDQKLAEALWTSGNHDARALAALIADPSKISARTLDSWAGGLDNYILADSLARVAAASPKGRARLEKWIGARDEFKCAAGWNVLAAMAGHGDETNAYWEKWIKVIEKGIHDAKNRVRHSMNQALIGIGIRNAALEKKATAAAKRIGKVEVDHGQTSCKTPDAAAYIKKTVAYRKKKAKKKTSRR